jgi:UPF0271 protein
MKLNCDLGESFGNWTVGLDEQVMPMIDLANVACGFHAGDPVVIAKTIALAKRHNVAIGAHPSYPDLVGFGRRSMNLSANELIQTLHYQISAVAGMASAQGMSIEYVKPHGALYNDMMKQPALLSTVLNAVAQYPLKLKLMLQSTANFEVHEAAAKKLGVELMFEAFADRCYTDEGLLVPRSESHAVHSLDNMLEQVKRLASNKEVVSESNQILSFPVDTLCVHGDNPTAVQHIHTIRELIDAG